MLIKHLDGDAAIFGRGRKRLATVGIYLIFTVCLTVALVESGTWEDQQSQNRDQIP
jgi:hypothetical protein